MMNEIKLEQELKQFDFSLCHPVREKLLGKLLTMQRMKKNREGFASQRMGGAGRWKAQRMTDDEMDWVAAAGTGDNVKPPFQEQSLHLEEKKHTPKA